MNKKMSFAFAFKKFFNLSFFLFFSILIVGCSPAPEDETGDDMTTAVFLSRTLINQASWNYNSRQLEVSGQISRDTREVKIFEQQNNGLRNYIDSVNVQRSGTWQLTVDGSSIDQVPCTIFATTRYEYQTLPVRNAPSNCGQANSVNQTSPVVSQVVLDGKILSPASNVSVTVGSSLTFNGSATSQTQNIFTRNKSRDKDSNDDENRSDNTDTTNVTTASNNLYFIWDFGEYAPRKQGQSVSLQFDRAGTVNVRLLIEDDAGNSDSTPDSIVIHVNDVVVNAAPNGSINSPSANTSIYVGDSVYFSGSGNDPEGGSLLYYWDFGASGIPASTRQNPGSVQFNRAGTYLVSLYVTDNNNLADLTPAQVSIVVNPVNQPPTGQILSPNSSQTINVGQSIFFDASASDPEDDRISYLWDFGDSGIAQNTRRSPGSFTFNRAGTFDVRLSVTDALHDHDEHPHQVRIVVNPAANNAPNGTINLPIGNQTINLGQSLVFQGNGTDADGDNISYRWNFGDSGIADIRGTTTGAVTFNKAGTFTITLTVKDEKGLSDPTPAVIRVTVNDNNADGSNAPDGTIVNPVFDQIVYTGDTLLFNATATDPDGDQRLTYIWDFGAYAPRKIGQSVSLEFTQPGDVFVKLLVKDSTDTYDPSPATLRVSVQSSTNTNNQPPESTILSPATDVTIAAGETVFFSGAATDPENNPNLDYLWVFDGAASDNFTATPGPIVFNTPGVYIVSFSSIDSVNQPDPTPAVRIITVTDANVIDAPVQQWLDPMTQPQFVNSLPIPQILQPTIINGYATYVLSMTEFQQDLGVIDPATGQSLLTTVWGYGGTYPGPTIVSRSTAGWNTNLPGFPVKVLWLNELPDRHILPVDPTVGCGSNAPNCQPEVRTVPHLHGGHTDADSDGHPNAWFSPGFQTVGSKFKASMNGIYTYRNDQEAANLWYHDHALGVTRLNVYAGLAGFYIIHDDNEDRLYLSNQLPDVKFDIPLLIQDKSFNTDGSLAYDFGTPVSVDPQSGEANPSVVPEFYGDMILVNGKTWPKMNVEPRVYRFRVLNGSNSRFYNLRFSAGTQDIPFHVIGTDGGFLDRTVTQFSSVMGPAERLDILVDFSDPALWGKRIIVTNDANSPYPNGDPVVPGATDRVMAFEVNQPLDLSIRQSIIPTTLRTNRIPTLVPTPGIPERELLLSEETDSFGRLLPQLGTSANGPLKFTDPVTERPVLGTTEIWKIINNTGDMHPIHQHLVQFRIVERQAFDVNSYVPGNPASLRLIGAPQPPAPDEAGWKDTVKAAPGEIVKIIARYDLLGEYVWHCHILEHEDHEMMRPFVVVQ